jgi:hypothetical protein
VLLLLLALYATRFWPAPVAALVWLLTFTTKQSVLPVALVMLCFYFERRLRTLAGVAILAVGASSIVLIANRLTAGWFSFYVFKVPQAGTHLIPRAAVLYLPLDIFAPMGIACLIILAAFLLVQLDWRQPHIRFYLLTLLFVPLCGYIRMHTGATTNTEMPVYAVLALLGALSFAWLDRWLQEAKLDPATMPFCRFGTIILLCVVSVQLWMGFYGPGDFVPTAGKKSSMEAILRETKQVSGDVYFPAHPYYGVLAGKTGYADMVSLEWVLAALDPVRRARLQEQTSEILDDRQTSAVFLDSPASIESMDEELHISSKWTEHFPVRGFAPNAAAGTRPSFLLSLCPLPDVDYQLASPPIAPKDCSTTP